MIIQINKCESIFKKRSKKHDINTGMKQVEKNMMWNGKTREMGDFLEEHKLTKLIKNKK
jgi:hypothetical protein